MNIREFEERLKKHDWCYMMSDDDRWYDAGLAEEKALLSICHGKVTYQRLYDKYLHKQFPKAKSPWTKQ